MVEYCEQTIMVRLGLFLLLSVLAVLAESKTINRLQAREFDLHNAIRMAYDADHLKQVLEHATEDEVKEFFISVSDDCKDIEDISTKLLSHDWTTEIELTDEEHELIFHVLIMNSYLPNVGDDGEDLFIDECKVEYMQTDFSEFSSFEDARLDAMVQILTCGFNGWRTLEKVLDIQHLDDAQLKDIMLITSILEKLSRGISELFTIGRFFAIIVEIDASKYPDPSSFNDALKQNAVEKMDHVERSLTGTKRTDTKVNAQKVEAVGRALENIKQIKNRMLIGKVVRTLNQKTTLNDALKRNSSKKMEHVSVAEGMAVTGNKRTDTKVNAQKVEAVSRALENIKDIKNRMLLHKLIRALDQKLD